MGKITSLVTTIIVALVGIILIFIPSIDMERFKVFTTAFAPFAVTLMVSIGCNAAIDKFDKKVKEELKKDEKCLD